MKARAPSRPGKRAHSHSVVNSPGLQPQRRHDLLRQAVASAKAEEVRGDCVRAAPETAAVLRDLAGPGRPLIQNVRADAEAATGGFFSSVRIHDDSGADRLTRAFGATAFALGRDIYARRGALGSRYPGGRRILYHELSHVARNHGNNRLHFWNKAGHRKITKEAIVQLQAAKRFDLEHIMTTSYDMDIFRGSRKPSARHGDAGGYVKSGAATAVQKNYAEQQRNLRIAVKNGKKYQLRKRQAKLSRYQDRATQQQIFKDRYWARVRTYNSLGDALHVAEDRGAHGEGLPGKGHGRRLPAPFLSWRTYVYEKGDSCDDTSTNTEGKKDALRHACEVLVKFILATGFHDTEKHESKSQRTTKGARSRPEDQSKYVRWLIRGRR